MKIYYNSDISNVDKDESRTTTEYGYQTVILYLCVIGLTHGHGYY